MKYTRLSSTVLTLSILALTGCAASAEGDEDGGPLDAAIKVDTGTKDAKATDANSNADALAACVALQCTSDQDCQNVCPEVPNGVECCDTSTGICYAYSSTVCPAPVLDAGFD